MIAHPPKAQRRLLTAGGGIGVAALAGGAFVLSFDYLRALALRGGASRHLAYLYPWMLDGLVVVVALSILMSRRSGWWSRTVRWLLLLALLAGAGAAGVEHAVRGYGRLSHAWVSGGVAVAPWAMLVLALWLWVAMIKQARRMRGDAAAPVPETAAETGLIPGLTDDEQVTPRPLPLPAPRALAPVRQAPPAVPGEPWMNEPAAQGPVPGEASANEPAWATDEPAAPAPGEAPAGEPVRATGEPATQDTSPAARTLLPTDVRLVGASPPEDTRPDGVKPPDTRPDGIPIHASAEDGAAAGQVTDAADADGHVLPAPAADDASEEPAEPPSSTFRSSPTPPE